MELKLREFFYISNLLSISRIFILIPFLYFVRANTFENNLFLLLVGIVGVTSDFLDGYFSRKLNQVTELGVILDPISDKIAITVILVSLIYYREFPIPLTILLVYRDLMILIVGAIVIRKTKKPEMANIFGKANTCIIAVTAIICMVDIKNFVFDFCVVVSYLSIFISGYSYLLVGEKLLFAKIRSKRLFRTGIFLLTFLVLYLTWLI